MRSFCNAWRSYSKMWRPTRTAAEKPRSSGYGLQNYRTTSRNCITTFLRMTRGICNADLPLWKSFVMHKMQSLHVRYFYRGYWKKTGNPTGDNSPGNKQLLIQGCAVSSANMSGAGRLRDFDLSCESSMTLSFLLRGRKEELLLPVMQKRSFSCRVRNSEPRKNLSCLAAY